jgi:hypothetical protein
MQAEGIALAAAEQAVQQGINNLSPKNKTIVTNSIFGIIGIALCVISVSQLVKVLFPKNQGLAA